MDQTETERELVAVERVQQYVNRIQPEQVGSSKWEYQQVGVPVSRSTSNSKWDYQQVGVPARGSASKWEYQQVGVRVLQPTIA